MGTEPVDNTPSIPGTDSIVAPYYGADIDTSIEGTVRYTQFTTNNYQSSTVSNFIRAQTGDSFTGNRMMVAEWYNVARYNGAPVSLFFIDRQLILSPH